jgi:hypothetical protein
MNKLEKLSSWIEVSFIFTLVLLSIHNLSLFSLWLDEAITALNVQGTVRNAWLMRQGDYNPPLHDLILIPFVRVFGIEDWVFRAPSILGYAGVLFFIWWKISKRSLRVICLIVFGCSLEIFQYSREGRPFALVVLFTSVLVFYVVERTVKKQNWSLCAIFFISMIFAVNGYLHYTGLVFVFCSVILLILFCNHLNLNFKNIIFLLLSLAFWFLPWMSTLFIHAQNTPPHLGSKSRPFVELINEITNKWLINPYFALIIIAILILGLLSSYQNKKSSFTSLLFLNMLWFFPFAWILFIVYVLSPSDIYVRYFFGCLPPLLISICYTLNFFYELKKGAGLILASLISAFFTANFLMKSPWNKHTIMVKDRSAAQYIMYKSNKECATLVSNNENKALEFYFLKNNFSNFEILESKYFSSDPVCAHVFLVSSIHKETFVDRVFEKFLKSFLLVELKEFAHLQVYYMRKI